MKTITIIKEGVTYEAIQVSRGNLGSVEWFTNGEIKCQTESFTVSGKCEIWCYKGDGMFWVHEGGFFLKDEKGNLDLMTEMEFNSLPTLEVIEKDSMLRKLSKLFNCKR